MNDEKNDPPVPAEETLAPQDADLVQKTEAPPGSKTPSGKIVAFERSEVFFGPLPHPSILAKYNEVIPDGADRLMALVEDEARHRRAGEVSDRSHGQKIESRGQMYAFVLIASFVLGGFVLIWFKRPAEGFSSMGIGVVTAVLNYFGKKSSSQKKRRKSVPQPQAGSARKETGASRTLPE